MGTLILHLRNMRVEGITTIEDVIEVDRDSISDAVEIVDEETESSG